MAHLAQQPNFTASDFLCWDEDQQLRHEYYQGEVFAMAGGTDNHATVILNAALAFRQHIKGTSCRVFTHDVKLHVQRANAYFYPDLFVTCSAQDAAQRLIKSEPTLVLEVLSPSTAAVDRGHKFEAYRSLSSLQEYVLIDPNAQTAEVYRRSTDDEWILRAYAKGQSVNFSSLALQISAADLFADVVAESALIKIL